MSQSSVLPVSSNIENSALPLDENTEDTHEEQRGSSRPSIEQASYLYVLLEADRPLAGGARYSLRGIDQVLIGRGATRKVSRQRVSGINQLVLHLPGRTLSSVHARLRREKGGWLLEDAGSTNGTYRNGARLTQAELSAGDIFELGRVFATVATSIDPDGPADLDDAELAAGSLGFATLVPSIAAELRDLQRVAASQLTVTLWGETGTGKEVLARAVHDASGRTGPFVAVSCGALGEGSAESKLFGHEPGAHTGTRTEAPGFVRSAQAGTLLLDEVQDLTPAAQAALLRVLQEREVVPLGSSRPVAVDVRFMATSPLALNASSYSSRFRQDLFSRLQGFSYRLHPLRERRPDLGSLLAALLRKLGVREQDRPTLSPELGLRLLRYDWPLNIRELEQWLSRGWILARDGAIDATYAPDLEAPVTPVTPVETSAASGEEQILRERLVRALEAAHGNVAEVARTLGRAPMQVRRWMKRFALDPNMFRAP